MPSPSDVLDRLLRLGEEIAEAVAADNWSRVEELVERRAEVAGTLPDQDEQSVESDLSDAARREKAEALADQNERLTGMLRDRRDEIEDELTQIGQMRNAQDSYGPDTTKSGVLPSELSG
ncbi:MAG: flagellar protein FliT [Salinibacter sp.]